jgi:hypothetical protein
MVVFVICVELWSPMAAHIPQPIAQTLTKYEPPLWLSHRPIWLLPYEPFDGIYAEETDCKYLSVGFAQYDPIRLSAKTFRYQTRWSRQSEELPIHRAIDLTLWVALTLFSSSNLQEIPVEQGTFHGQDEEFVVKCLSDDPVTQEAAVRALSGEGPAGEEYRLVRERLTKLKETLIALGL